MDSVSKEKRSWIMGRIRSRDTKPERDVAAALRREGIAGWRRQRKVFGISVDFAWPKHKVLLMVQGCFWHSHNCRRFRMPKSNRAWWRRKLARNAERDREQIQKFEEGGWLCIKFWECRIHRMTSGAMGRLMDSVRKALVDRAVSA